MVFYYLYFIFICCVVRGIPAQKWQTTWSEHNEIQGTPWMETYAMNMDAVATYYWSNSSWDFAVSGWDTVPLRLDLEGTYTWYNKSDITGEYDILWTTNTFKTIYTFVAFNAGEPDEEYFAIPQQYKQCNISVYCDKYPRSDVCLGTVPIDCGETSESKNEEDNKLNPGYIVIMVLLFFIGLFLGVAADRCYVRSHRQRVSFQKMHDAEVETDARL